MTNQNIIQRRGRKTSTLPITNNDVQKEGHKKLSSISVYDRTSPLRWCILLIVSMIIGTIIWKPIVLFLGSKSTQSATQHDIHLNEKKVHQQSHSKGIQNSRSLSSQFSKLAFALHNSDLVALYFAASWCPMSTPISIALDKAFGNKDYILTPTDKGRKPLSIVYVSSDRDVDEYNEYIENRNWLAIPFESAQRTNIKKHFKTCAHRELEELDIDRKHEIPTIIVIDSETEGIITTNGADDLDDLGAKAFDHWKDMQSWIKKRSSKYDNI